MRCGLVAECIRARLIFSICLFRMMALVLRVMGQAVWDFQAVRFHQSLVRENGANRSIGNKPTLVHEKYAGARFANEFEIMCGYQLGSANGPNQPD